jgi:hypothetical protein
MEPNPNQFVQVPKLGVLDELSLAIYNTGLKAKELVGELEKHGGKINPCEFLNVLFKTVFIFFEQHDKLVVLHTL